jgi:hypothetical protein
MRSYKQSWREWMGDACLAAGSSVCITDTKFQYRGETSEALEEICIDQTRFDTLFLIPAM